MLFVCRNLTGQHHPRHFPTRRHAGCDMQTLACYADFRVSCMCMQHCACLIPDVINEVLDKFMEQTSSVDAEGRASFDVFAHRAFVVCRSAHAANMLAGFQINAIMSVQCSAGCHRSNVVARALQQFLNCWWNSDGHKHRNCCARACTSICRMQIFV